MKSLSLILPIHNCAHKLRSNVQLLLELLPNLTREFQIIIVDDGSDDGSGDIAAELTDRFPQISAVYHSQRRGEKAAIDSGLNLVRNELTFVQATDTIEEVKIRNFLSHHGLNQPKFVQQENLKPAEVAIERAPIKPVRTAIPVVHDGDQTTSDVQLENRLVERLMQWGTALREYQQQSSPAAVFDQPETATADSDSFKEFYYDQPLKAEPDDFEMVSDDESEELTAVLETVEEESPADEIDWGKLMLRSRRTSELRSTIAPPNYTSVPELRLTRLSQMDLGRKAQACV